MVNCGFQLAMNEISYSKSQYPVREDFAASHNRYWKRLAAPGSWLTGTQRVDVAKEVRQAQQCSLCRRRKEALSPYQVDGAHDVVSALPDVMVEVIHRVTTDPGRLTKTWFDGIKEQGLGEEAYVEIIGTLVFVFSIDEFCRGLDIPLNELPRPRQNSSLENTSSIFHPIIRLTNPIHIRSHPNQGLSGVQCLEH